MIIAAEKFQLKLSNFIMARGGARKNTGPKPKLTMLQKYWVATQFRSIQMKEASMSAQDAFASAYTGTEYDELVAELHETPMNMYMGKTARKWVTDNADSGATLPYDPNQAELYEIIIDGTETLLNIRKHIKLNPRYFSARIPKGRRKYFLEQTARWAFEEYGVKITPRYVQRCIDDTRNYLSEDK